ncbi:MAG: hypothetical protein M3162_04665 [Thermoproteota archaeon]|nr:hypothetical protein [Thermoproteota archaeon]
MEFFRFDGHYKPKEKVRSGEIITKLANSNEDVHPFTTVEEMLLKQNRR